MSGFEVWYYHGDIKPDELSASLMKIMSVAVTMSGVILSRLWL